MRKVWVSGLAVVLAASTGRAGSVNFDSSADGTAIAADTFSNAGISFTTSAGSTLYVAEEGGALEAFTGLNGQADTVAPQVADAPPQRFLAIGPSYGTIDTVKVSYAVPASHVRGDILDLDGGESWTVTAFDSLGAQVAQILLDASSPGAGDGQATPWEFNGADIRSVLLTGMSRRPLGAGLDNFTFDAAPQAAIPTPTAVGAGLVTLLCLGVASRWKRA